MLKNITLSADEALIQAARTRAVNEKTTLNAQFRRWLESYVGRQDEGEKRAQAFRETMDKLRGKVVTERKFTRDEMNER